MKLEVSDLKAELKLIKGGETKDHLNSEEIERCNIMVKDFIESNDPHKTLVMPDRLMINHCFYHFKTLYKNIERKRGAQPLSGIVQQSPQPKAIEAEDSSADKNEKGNAI